MTDRPADCVALHALHDRRGLRVTTVAARLPGWTGGKGFFIGDGGLPGRHPGRRHGRLPALASACRAAACRATRGGEWLAVEELRVAA
ncbi:MAG: hypothetical protein R2854_27810 [Caldilineaceae bacterium]